MKKIIMPEDVHSILKRDQSFLDRSDIRIYTANTNVKALALHRTEKADLIIVKIKSPEMSGENFCSLIRSDNELKKVSIIIVSSEEETELQRCLQCRANAFITIPIHNSVLLQEMYQLLHVAPRKSCRVPVRMKIYGKSKRTAISGHAENISLSGMLFRCGAAFDEGDMMTCSFSLPDSTEIAADAEIVRVIEKGTGHDANRYGIKFTDIGSAFSTAIELFVERECQHA